MKAIIKSLYQNSINKKVKELIFNAFSKYYNIRISAGFNPNTPASVLEYLSNDQNDWIRCYVAENINTPVSILKKLSNDKNENVRYFVASNLNWIESRNKNI